MSGPARPPRGASTRNRSSEFGCDDHLQKGSDTYSANHRVGMCYLSKAWQPRNRIAGVPFARLLRAVPGAARLGNMIEQGRARHRVLARGLRASGQAISYVSPTLCWRERVRAAVVPKSLQKTGKSPHNFLSGRVLLSRRILSDQLIVLQKAPGLSGSPKHSIC